MQYLRDVSEMSCGTTAIMQMRLQQDSSNSSRIVRITATSKFLNVIFSFTNICFCRCVVELHCTAQDFNLQPEMRKLFNFRFMLVLD